MSVLLVEKTNISDPMEWFRDTMGFQEDWLNIAHGRELIYGYFSDDDLSAEFIHIKNGECILCGTNVALK